MRSWDHSCWLREATFGAVLSCDGASVLTFRSSSHRHERASSAHVARAGCGLATLLPCEEKGLAHRRSVNARVISLGIHGGGTCRLLAHPCKPLTCANLLASASVGAVSGAQHGADPPGDPCIVVQCRDHAGKLARH